MSKMNYKTIVSSSRPIRFIEVALGAGVATAVLVHAQHNLIPVAGHVAMSFGIVDHALIEASQRNVLAIAVLHASSELFDGCQMNESLVIVVAPHAFAGQVEVGDLGQVIGISRPSRFMALGHLLKHLADV